jgi:hypothetical protein
MNGYSIFRGQQPLYESAYPERFSGADEWIALAERASKLGGIKRYSPEEWATKLGLDPSLYSEPITASSLWDILPDYEQLRLEAKFVNLEGLEQIRQKKNELMALLRQERDPARVRGLRAVVDILTAAETQPDRRPDLLRLARQWDILTIGIYRLRQPPKRVAPDIEAYSLRRRGCVPEGTRVPFLAATRVKDSQGRYWVCPVTMRLRV